MGDEKPLFIPLKREYFLAFEDGTKDTEYRRPRGPWNLNTCCPGRRVVLSLGYGKARRLTGTIVSFGVHALMPDKYEAFRACYPDAMNLAACIRIELDRAPAQTCSAVRKSGYWKGYPCGATPKFKTLDGRWWCHSHYAFEVATPAPQDRSKPL